MKKNTKHFLILLGILCALGISSVMAYAASLGDADDNGKLEAADARIALRIAVGLESFEGGDPQYVTCDVDFNDKVDAADARQILRAAVGLEILDGLSRSHPAHAWTSKTLRESTCAQYGEAEKNCSVCGAVQREKLGLKEHFYQKEIVKRATCGEDGQIRTYCTRCGASSYEAIPAGGAHSWDAGSVANGVITYTCKVCGKTKTESAPAANAALLKLQNFVVRNGTYKNGQYAIDERYNEQYFFSLMAQPDSDVISFSVGVVAFSGNFRFTNIVGFSPDLSSVIVKQAVWDNLGNLISDILYKVDPAKVHTGEGDGSLTAVLKTKVPYNISLASLQSESEAALALCLTYLQLASVRNDIGVDVRTDLGFVNLTW